MPRVVVGLRSRWFSESLLLVDNRRPLACLHREEKHIFYNPLPITPASLGFWSLSTRATGPCLLGIPVPSALYQNRLPITHLTHPPSPPSSSSLRTDRPPPPSALTASCHTYSLLPHLPPPPFLILFTSDTLHLQLYCVGSLSHILYASASLLFYFHVGTYFTSSRLHICRRPDYICRRPDWQCGIHSAR